MAELRCDYHQGGVHLPDFGLWLDAHGSRKGPERVFVSHAHSDHLGRHREVILSEVTSRLMHVRLPGRRVEHRLPWRQPVPFTSAPRPWQITLLPAGHIFGSAMALVESDLPSVLYTGDFRLRPSRSAEPCEPVVAHTLIMETTFGRPRYVFPPADVVFGEIIDFCRRSLEEGVTPVLLGYALGKSQEVLLRLGDAGLSLALHPNIARLADVYRDCGQTLPACRIVGESPVRGCVVLCPPGSQRTPMMQDLGPLRTAVLTGWAMDAGCHFRYGADLAFPLSDHADYMDLLAFVDRVRPRRVLTLHGFAADFATTLRRRGIEAWALSEDNQLELPMLI